MVHLKIVENFPVFFVTVILNYKYIVIYVLNSRIYFYEKIYLNRTIIDFSIVNCQRSEK